MRIFKIKKKRNVTTVFFILAFTVGILIFLIGNSAIVSEKKRVEELNSGNSTLISFKNYEGVTFGEVINTLKEYDDLTIMLRKAHYEQAIGIETRLLPKNEELRLDMKSGTNFTKDTLKDDGNNGIYSSRFDEEIVENIIGTEEGIKINKIGSYYETDKIVIISNKLFETLYKDAYMQEIQIFVKGEKSSIENLTNDLVSKFESKKREGSEEGILTKPMKAVEDLAESKALYNASILIFIVTIINSISISSLWVKNRKKEIVLRKVFGAKNRDIAKIFFGELALISLLSVMLAVIIQQILINSTIGFISNIDLRFNFESLMNSIMVSIGVAFLTAIPSLRYISKIQPAEMLKED